MRQGRRAAPGLGDRAGAGRRRSRGAPLSGGAPGPAAAALAAALGRAGWSEVEVHEKRGRSRRYELGPEGESVASADEAGWAVRAGGLEGSFFAAGTGAPPAVDRPWPAPTPHPLRLPDPRPVPPWPPPPGLDAPLATEAEAWALLAELEREVRRELPTARLTGARLDDGASESALASSRGVAAAWRSRAALLRLELEAGGATLVVEEAARDPRAFRAAALGRRVVDRFLARRGEGRPAADELVLAAPLAARLVEALAPLFVGRAAESRLAPWLDAGRRIGSPLLTLIDDGRAPAGALAAPVDGEGLPTGTAVLVDAGTFVRPLLGWWESDGGPWPGCARRASWRDLPRWAPTQLFVAPREEVGPGELIEAAAAGAALIAAEGAVRIDPGGGRFRVPVTGFALERGRATAPLGLRWLRGDLGALLGGLVGVARDLAFVAGDGLYGAPTLLVRGLELGEPVPPGAATTS